MTRPYESQTTRTEKYGPHQYRGTHHYMRVYVTELILLWRLRQEIVYFIWVLLYFVPVINSRQCDKGQFLCRLFDSSEILISVSRLRGLLKSLVFPWWSYFHVLDKTLVLSAVFFLFTRTLKIWFIFLDFGVKEWICTCDTKTLLTTTVLQTRG